MGGRLSRACLHIAFTFSSHITRNEHAERTHQRRHTLKVKRTHLKGPLRMDSTTVQTRTQRTANNDNKQRQQRDKELLGQEQEQESKSRKVKAKAESRKPTMEFCYTALLPGR